MKRYISTLIGIGAAITLPASAALIVDTSAVGGVPSGQDLKYFTFNDSSLTIPGSGSWTTLSTDNLESISVVVAPNGKAVTGAKDGEYAAPVLSGGQGSNFGNQPNGTDSTIYLTSGTTGGNGSIRLTFAEPKLYLGLLWGSVDDYNTLSFYDSNNVKLGEIGGSDVTPSATGDQSASGTYYVNINSDTPFSYVVATSTQFAFEFDNVAVSAKNVSVPDGGSTLALTGLGLGLLGLIRRKIA
ncbi:MAG: VPDSG-CTERM sorting domain-containing protein [Verrucomicrobia bacterium]|nr:VPDSG-CTERM sorting domain-containing protein [Verrucomicrobiota bacterium]